MCNLTLSLGCLILASTCLSQQNQHHLYTFHGDSVGDYLGWSVSGAGDVNRDGFADLIVGMPFDDNNGEDSGSARVFSGKDGRVLHTFHGDSARDNFGSFVAGAGDVNRDGFPDVIVGAMLDDNNGTDSGSARVFSGRFIATRTGPPILYTFNGDSVDARFGYCVNGAGDVNNDGHSDLIVGGFLGGNNGRQSGMVRVFSGKDGKTLYTFHGDSAGDRLGVSVSGAGDVNKDGFADLIAGAYLDDNNGLDSGSARVFSGKDGKVLYTFNGDSANDRFGSSVSGAGDVDKDGYDDLIVGAFLDDNNGFNSGSARVFSGKDGKVLYTFNGDSAGDLFGWAVSGAGDVNKDGHADVIVGATHDDNAATDSGSARVLSGKDGKVLYTFNGDGAYDAFGQSVSGAGDVNRDGVPDFIVGAHFDDNNGFDSGSGWVLSGQALTLTTDSHAVSLAKANTQTLYLDAGTAHKGRSYWVLGSVTGTSPGVTLASAIGLVTIPLNPDPWTERTITVANSPVLVNTKGTLDANGQAKAQLKGGPVNAPSAIGLVLYHAYVVYDQNNNFYTASNPVTLLLVQ